MRKNESFGGLALCKSALGKKLVDDGVLMTKEEEKLGLVHDCLKYNGLVAEFLEDCRKSFIATCTGLDEIRFFIETKKPLN